ncbi:hypothetical protein K5D38_11545 [Pseudomonas cichorii]|nr:hypothetical protein [Pseudomonas cichorii]
MKEKIEELSKNLRDILRNNAGGFQLPTGWDQTLLFNNGIEPHILGFDELITLGSEIGKNLFLANRGSFTTPDHYLFWSWTGAILLDFIPDFEPHLIYSDSDLSSLLSTSLCAALDQVAFSVHLYQKDQKENIMAHMGFPLIEALSRKTLHEYMNQDGKVTQPFTIKKNPPKEDRLYKKKSNCSSMSDALSFAIVNQKNPLLQNKLQQLIDELKIFAKEQESGIDFLYTLRNEALHAGRTASTIGGALLTIGLLLCLGLIEDRYDELRRKISEKVLIAQRGFPMGWTHLYASWSKLPV